MWSSGETSSSRARTMFNSNAATLQPKGARGAGQPGSYGEANQTIGLIGR